MTDQPDEQDEPTVSMCLDEVDLMLLRGSVRRQLRIREKDVRRNEEREMRQREVEIGRAQVDGLKALMVRLNRGLTVVRAMIRDRDKAPGGVVGAEGLRALSDAATPGEWQIVTSAGVGISAQEVDSFTLATTHHVSGLEQSAKDAEFIVAAVNHVRAALAAALPAPVGEGGCPTPCDDDCPNACHETHEVSAKRHHPVETCPGTLAAGAKP